MYRLAVAGGIATAAAASYWRVTEEGRHTSTLSSETHHLPYYYCQRPDSSAKATTSNGLTATGGEGGGTGRHCHCHCERKERVLSEPLSTQMVQSAGRGDEGLLEVVNRSRDLVRRVMLEQGVPGAVLAVAKDGRIVWSEGIGLADVENDTPCTPKSGDQ